MERETRLVKPPEGHVSPPLDRAATTPYEDGAPGAFFYQRYGHAPGAEAERLLGELDGGHALLFASGSASITCIGCRSEAASTWVS